MSVFTIFNHGTDFHRDKQKAEIISLLSNAMIGNEAIIVQNDKAHLGYSLQEENPNYMICEGPGSDTVTQKDSMSDIDHTWPGNDNPITREQAKSTLIKQQTTLKEEKWFGEGGNKEFQDSFYGNTPKPWKLTGKIIGKGWNDNVYKAVWMLTHLLFSKKQKIDTVNIIGWSRGAVTCLKQANLLNEVLPDLKINILAIDPVPGKDPNTHLADTKTITKNIKTYWAIEALNEIRNNFRCTDPSTIINDSPNAWIEHLPMPGNHSDVVRPNVDTQKSLCDGSLNELHISKSYKVVLNITHLFLTSFGTGLKDLDKKSDDTYCLKLYGDMYRDRDIINEEYKNYKPWSNTISSIALKRYIDRDINKKYYDYDKQRIDTSTDDDKFSPYIFKEWINIHHKMLAKVKNASEFKNFNPTVNEGRISKWVKLLGS